MQRVLASCTCLVLHNFHNWVEEDAELNHLLSPFAVIPRVT